MQGTARVLFGILAVVALLAIGANMIGLTVGAVLG